MDIYWTHILQLVFVRQKKMISGRPSFVWPAHILPSLETQSGRPWGSEPELPDELSKLTNLETRSKTVAADPETIKQVVLETLEARS
jgi:hypothetical protein